MVSKRLQVVMSEADLKTYERVARGRGVSLSEWVRGALRRAREAEPRTSAEKKLAAVRAATRHHFPAPDIDQMLVEIERGYGQGTG